VADSLDSFELRADEIAFHQWVTTAADAALHARQLEMSASFVPDGDAAPGQRFEWRSPSSEHETSSFPLARVTLAAPVILFETCAERRLDELRRVLVELGFPNTSADQTRAIPIADALDRPAVLTQPLGAAGEPPHSFEGVAALFVRMGWAFLPHEGLSGRTPDVAVRTPRGATALERVIQGLPAELQSWHPGLSGLSRRKLHDLLLPAPADPRATAKERQTADDRRRS
jgi:hypothetical protein